MIPGITQLRSLLARHRGWRGLCVLLAFALTCMTWPQWEVHAHAATDHAHAHPHPHQSNHDLPDAPAATDLEATASVHVHVHDAHAPSFMPSARIALVTRAPGRLWEAPPALTAATYPARPPPHRPPIA